MLKKWLMWSELAPANEGTRHIEWAPWGDQDPRYGVAAWEGREKADISLWTEEEFYRLGKREGFVDIAFLTLQTQSNGSAHSFVMAGKGE